jgi:non-ribosomal peptide synthetase component F
MELAGLTLCGVSAAATTSKFDLTLWMAESPSGLLGSFEYSTDLFDEATIERMASHLRALLRGRGRRSGPGPLGAAGFEFSLAFS